MLYTELIKKAMRIAFDAHKEQTDKTGMPYIFHPIHLAEQMDTEIEICVALLHDVAEDTDISFDDLQTEGFPDKIINTLMLLTHDKDVNYFEYIEKMKSNPIAVKVKLADLRHNGDASRLETVDDEMERRLDKYQRARKLLTDDTLRRGKYIKHEEDHIIAHKYSINHKPELEKDSICGCFYCLEIFKPDRIGSWLKDTRGTAMCPFCSIDSVIGESSGYPVTTQFLSRMHDYWFKH